MATSVKDFFDRRVPEALAANPGRAKDVAAVYLFRITGSQGGTWTVDLMSNPPHCSPGESANPACTIELSDQDFCTMVEGGMQAAMQILFAGKLKITGDSSLITRLTSILQMGS